MNDFPGYDLVDRGRMAELETDYLRLVHRRSGAEFLSLHNADTNKVFGVTVRTLPSDSTGLPHIMEHSVLCGSRRYPVKEPFVHLLKASLQTFLNAFTFPDKTCYPVASENLQDFLNLARVYLDAVFFPLIGEAVFEQEGWHYECGDAADELTCQGVVYNEMKGAYSDPLGLLDEATRCALFQRTPYAFDAGGDPAVIPTLTYADFKAFHTRYYHPGNCLFYIYGDAPLAARFDLLNEYLDQFTAAPAADLPPLAAGWGETRRLEYPFDAGDAPQQEKAAMIVLNWLWPADAEPLERLALTVLDYMLIGSSAAPLRKALIDSGLGESLLGGGLHLDLRQLYFSVGLKGIRLEDADRVEQLVLETLGRLSREGIDPAMRAAALNTVEFSLRENNSGGFPQGLVLMLRALGGWLYGKDPIGFLSFEASLTELKRQAAAPRFFERRLDQHLLENTSRVRVLLAPERGHAAAAAERERARLARIKAAMSQAEQREVVHRTALLKELQQRPDEAVHLAQLPSLKLEDLERRQAEVPFREERVAGRPLLCHALPTHGLVYLDLALDLHGLDADLVAPLRIFCRALRETGTAGQDFVALSQRIDRETGGISFSPWVSSRLGTDSAAALLLGRGKATAEKIEELCRLMQELLLTARLDNRERIQQLIRQERSALEAHVIPAGHHFALQRAGAAWSQAGWAAERINGIAQIAALRELEQQAATNWDGVLEVFRRMHAAVVRRAGLSLNITTEAKFMPAAQAALAQLVEALPDGSAAAVAWPFGSGRPDEGFCVPSTVHYVAKTAELYRLGYRYHGSMEVAVKHLNANYLWQKVRVEGGAYGGFCFFSRLSGVFGFASYRDPHCRRTLDLFDHTAGFMRSQPVDREQLRECIIGTIGAVDAYQLPDAKGVASFIRWMLGVTPEQRQEMRDQILGTTPEDVRELAGALEAAAAAGRICVLGPQRSLEEQGGKLELAPLF